MNINRHNYEEFFLMYVDNELTAAQRTALETFVEENPDLRAELEMLQDTVMQPEENISFGNLASLLKQESSHNTVNTANCEEYFVLYGDNELSAENKTLVEEFIARNPAHKADFELMQKAKLTADTSVVFPDKSSLYRYENERRIIPIHWWKIAAAASVVLLLGGYGWYSFTNNEEINHGNVAGITTAVKTIQPAKVNKGTIPVQQTQDTPSAAITTETGDQADVKNSIAPTGTINTGNDSHNNKTQVVEKAGEGSNKNPSEIVTPIAPLKSETDKPNEKAPQGKEVNIVTDLTPAATVTATIASPQQLNATPVVAAVPESNNLSDEDDNTTNAKKSSLRGLFRKVARTLDKATNSESGEDEKSGNIRIASFSIAVK